MSSHHHGFIRRRFPFLDPDDVLQDALLRAWEGLSSFRGESDLSSWIWGILWNTAKEHARMKHRREVSNDELCDLTIANIPSAERSMIAQDELRRVMAQIDQLPDAQRRALSVRVLDDEGYGNAERLNLCRARARLRSEL
jgi:RNA polymerase sigma-70 factor, ECF subfamily